MSETETDRVLTTREVAAMFAVDPRTVWTWANTGKLNGFKTPGGHLRFKESVVLARLREVSDQ